MSKLRKLGDQTTLPHTCRVAKYYTSYWAGGTYHIDWDSLSPVGLENRVIDIYNDFTYGMKKK